MPSNVVEVISRRPLPDTFKKGQLKVIIFNKWSSVQVATWAKDQYWFQTFTWSPKKKADSGLVWDTIKHECPWSGRRVLDIGAHYGYHSIQAADAGADVVGFEPEEPSRTCALLIDQQIEQQGVDYVAADPGGPFDVILYLSVHHQIDPAYNDLASTLQQLKSRCKDLFVELILPSSWPEFGGGMKDDELDKLVGGVPLLTYKHRVRASRRIYHIQGSLE